MKPLLLFCCSLLFLLSTSEIYAKVPLTVKNITLKSFQATIDGNMTRLVWDLDRMENEVTCFLERSLDGIEFKSIATYTIAKGFSGTMSANDNNLKAGQYYYRLRMIKHGFFPYISPVVTARISAISAESSDMMISNPFHSQITIQGSFSGKPLVIEICDFSGRLRMVQNINNASSGKTIRFPAGNLQKGMYILRVKEGAKGEDLLLTKWIIKQSN